MMRRSKSLLSMLLIAMIVITMNSTYLFTKTVQAEDTAANTVFTYENKGKALTYSVISLPGETEAGTVKIIKTEANQNLAGELVIPDQVNYNGAVYNVIMIDTGAFQGNQSLIKVSIPDSVTRIEDDVFQGCSSLVDINLPAKVTSIGNAAFWGCSRLTAINLPYGLTNIGTGAFAGCSNLVSINLPDGIIRIASYTFLGCESLSEIRIPTGVTMLGDDVFYGCSSLKSITIPEGVSSIGSTAFTGGGIENIHVYNNTYALNYCKQYYADLYQIINLPLEEMLLTENVKNIAVGDTVSLDLDFYPIHSSDITNLIVWSSSDQDVASVNENGEITGVSDGEAVITAKMGDYSASSRIIVGGETVNPEAIGFSKTTMEMNKGETFLLQPQFTPTDTTNQQLTWVSSDETVISVDHGRIYAKGVGTATITVQSAACQAECTITVNSPMREIHLYNPGTLNKGESKKLVLTYSPVDTTDDRTVVWSSSNEAVVTVENGIATAVGVGFATIEAKVGAFTQSIPVTVEAPLKSIAFTGTEFVITAGQTYQLPIDRQPADTTDTIAFSSSDETIVKVDSYGKATAIGIGTASITASTLDGSRTASCFVTVKPSAPSTLKAESKGYNSLKITWQAVSGASGYRVYRATSATGTYTRIATATSALYTDTGLTTGKTYYYKVKTYRSVGEQNSYSSYSEVKGAMPIPSTPSDLKVTKMSSSSAKVSWSRVSGASGYQIYRATVKTGTYSYIKSTAASYAVNYGLTSGKTYYYKVRAYRLAGTKKIYSKFTSIVSVKL